MTSEMDDRLIGQFARGNVPLVFLDVGTPGLHISNIAGDLNEAVGHL